MYRLCMVLFLCLLVGIACITGIQKELFKERKTMNSFITHDEAGNAFYLECEKIQGQSPQLTQRVQQLSDILIQTYTQQELHFARLHPEAISQDYFLKPLAPLFQEGIGKIDWKIVEDQIRAIFNQFFTQTEFAQFSPENEINYFVTAKDNNGKLLGFIQFLINPNYLQGTVKAGIFGINSEDLQPELRKVLMSSIFRIIPEIKRIIVHTRATNTALLDLYSKWGFMHVQDGYWVNSEYIIANSKTLRIG